MTQVQRGRPGLGSQSHGVHRRDETLACSRNVVLLLNEHEPELSRTVLYLSSPRLFAREYQKPGIQILCTATVY